MCFVFILTIDIRIDSIPLPTAQQTAKQIPFMVYQRPIQGTYTAKVVSNCGDSPTLMVVLHSNYCPLVQTTTDTKHSCESISFNTAIIQCMKSHSHKISSLNFSICPNSLGMLPDNELSPMFCNNGN